MIRCTKCGHDCVDSSKFCRACGNPFSTIHDTSTNPPIHAEQRCSSCETPLATGAKFCKKCGTAVVETKTTVSPIPSIDTTQRDFTTPPVEASPQEVRFDASLDASRETFAIDEVGTLPDVAQSSQDVSTAPVSTQQGGNAIAAVEVAAGSVCAKCASPLQANAKFCKACGTPVVAHATAPTTQSVQSTQSDFAPAASPDSAYRQPTQATASVHVTPGQSNASAKPPKLVLMLVSAAAVIVVIGGVAGFVWHSSKTADSVADSSAATPVDSVQTQATAKLDAPTPAPTPTASPAAQASAATPPVDAPTPTTGSVENKPAVSEPSPPVAAPAEPKVTSVAPSQPIAPVHPVQLPPPEKTMRATKPTPPIVIAPQPAPIPAVAPPASNPLAQKITALLAKADGYISNQQFDKAVATAESVLELDPGNASATATIKRAKTKQLELLKSGSSVE